MDLTEMTDRTMIAEALSAYCDFVDRSDVDALVGLYTADVTIDMGHGALFRGRERLRALLLDRIGLWETTNHHWSNLRVLHYDGVSASVVSHLHVYHDDPSRGVSMQLWGRYEDELVKQRGGWLFHVRRLRVAGVEEAPSTPVPDRFERFARMPLPARPPAPR